MKPAQPSAFGWMLVGLGVVGSPSLAAGEVVRFAKLPAALRDQIKMAEAAAADKNWTEAVEGYLRLMRTAAPDALVEVGEGRAVGLRAYCRQKIRALPEDAQQVYRESATMELRRALALAKAMESADILWAVASKFPGSDQASQAKALRTMSDWDEGLMSGRGPGDRWPGLREALTRQPATSISKPATAFLGLERTPWSAPADVKTGLASRTWMWGDDLLTMDEAGRILVIDPSGMVLRETPTLFPPANRMAQPVKWVTGFDESGGVLYLAEPMAEGRNASRDQIRNKLQMIFNGMVNDRFPGPESTSPDGVRLHAFSLEGHQGVWKSRVLQIDAMPLALQAKGSTVWIAGLKAHMNSMTPVVACRSLSREEEGWGVEVGTMLGQLGMDPAGGLRASAVVLRTDPTHQTLLLLAGGVLLASLDAATGDIHWAMDLSTISRRKGGFEPNPGGREGFGEMAVTESACVVASSDQALVAGFDLETGEMVWKQTGDVPSQGRWHGVCGRGDTVVAVMDGVLQCRRAHTGERLWEYPLEGGPAVGEQAVVTGPVVTLVRRGEVVHLDAETGQMLKSWKRPSPDQAFAVRNDRVMYVVSEAGVEPYVDDVITTRPQEFPKLAAAASWAKKEFAAALSLAIEGVKASSGADRASAQRRLSKWCRTVARELAKSRVWGEAVAVLERSLPVMSGGERAVLEWDIATLLDEAGRQDEAKRAYEALMQRDTSLPLVEVNPGSFVNIRQLAKMRYQRLTKVTLVEPPVGANVELVMGWTAPIQATRLVRLAALNGVIAVIADNGMVTGYGQTDGKVLWQRRADDMVGGLAGMPGGNQRLQRPGWMEAQFQGQIAVDELVVINGERVLEYHSSQGGFHPWDLAAYRGRFVLAGPRGVMALEPETGATQWMNTFERPAAQVPRLMPTESVLVAAWMENSDMRVVALQPDMGEVAWKTRCRIPSYSGPSVWTPTAFHPLNIVPAAIVSSGPYLMVEESPALWVRELATGKKLWEKHMTKLATILPVVGGEKPGQILADPWSGWDQTSQLLPIDASDGSVTAGVSLPSRTRLVLAKNDLLVVLGADPVALTGLNREDRSVRWRFALDASLLQGRGMNREPAGLWWCDQDRIAVMKESSLRVIRTTDGQEVVSLPIKRSAPVAGTWIQPHLVAVATTTELQVFLPK